jgi:3-oxoacyl-[acyl-carrier-protein] synthase I
VNTQRLDPAIAINYQIENGAGEINRVLSNSFGFGGSNCTLVLGRQA